jgi:hypothetical protein
VLVLVASARDPAARALAGRWSEVDARLLTPADMSRRGWRFDPAAPEEGTAVIAGRPTPVAAMEGVLTRLPTIFEADLPHIVGPDRAYVAQEMSAFMLAWLSSLHCPVVNRPVPPSLAGPGWRHRRWLQAAEEAGLRPARDDDEGRTLTVVGGECVGAAEPELAEQAARLAAAAAVDLLAVRVAGAGPAAQFLAADPWPDPSYPAVADALLTYFRRGDGP